LSYTVIILEDHVPSGEATQREIAFWDPQAHVELARTVPEAQTLVRSQPDVAFVVVDLLLEQASQQGSAFVRWLLDEPEYATVEILVLSARQEMIEALERMLHSYDRSKRQRVTIVKRTSDLTKIQAAFKNFIEHARARFV
jgi:CheY-like chemotaxis protein